MISIPQLLRCLILHDYFVLHICNGCCRELTTHVDPALVFDYKNNRNFSEVIYYKTDVLHLLSLVRCLLLVSSTPNRDYSVPAPYLSLLKLFSFNFFL